MCAQCRLQPTPKYGLRKAAAAGHLSCVRWWHEIKKVPIDSVDDSAYKYGVRDWVQWGRSRCGARGGDMDNVLNYLDNIVNPLVMMDNPPAGLALHDVSGSAASDGILTLDLQ